MEILVAIENAAGNPEKVHHSIQVDADLPNEIMTSIKYLIT
jgi:hypothetical protein